MADVIQTPKAGGRKTGTYINALGAIISLGLIAGVAVWGYKIVVRDVSGVPVVRAMPGQMRVAPENPGTGLALNEGLAVNDVAAQGGSLPGDQLVLAPTQTELTAQDLAARLDQQNDAEALDAELVRDDAAQTEIEVALQDEVPELQDAPLTAEEILALADRIAADVAPLSPLEVPETASVAAETTLAEPTLIAASVPGLSQSRRPVRRPASLSVPLLETPASVVAATAVVAEAAAEPDLLSNSEIAVGTRLVQLGAFDSAEIAASEWQRINIKFAELMFGKTRVIQQATSGGRVFFRLRAVGFEDISDARRFCSALVAENAECIPVLAR